MAHKTVLVVPSAAVAQNGTFTATLPTGFNAGQMASYGHKMFSRGLQMLFTQDAGQMSVSFSGATATVTYKGATSIPANTAVDCEFHIAGKLDDTVLTNVKRTLRASVYRLPLGSPAAKASNNISASQSVVFATTPNALLNGSLLAGGRILLDVPRNVVAAWTNTAVLTVTGKDEYGVVVVEKSASSTSFTGKKAFAEITNVAVSADVTGLTVGTGDVIGLPVFVDGVARILAEFKAGVPIGGNNDKVYISVNVPLTDGTYAVSASPIAGTITKIKAIVQGVFTTNNAVLTFKNNTTGITGGVITELVAAVAVGDEYSVAPTAANTVAADDKIMVVVSGTPGASKTTQVVIEITPTVTPNGTFVAGDQTVATGTTGDVRGTYAPALANDGSAYELLVDLPDPQYLGSAQYGG